ncbi:MAG: YidC/Oxa1 family membrane protein insertase, partial [Eubacteriales bacterium]|nr:YidC/Oxa1 family membrane protein insertase [Eubacteriales bacterium]
MLLTKYNGIILGPIASLLGMFMNGIFFVLNKMGIPNIGLAIIIMTILIYMCMLPLTIKQQKFSKLQRKMQPELNRINKKYEGRKDSASVEKQQQEIQAVYKKYGVSATGSCVQLLIQMPILLALYRVFYSIPAYVPMVKQAYFPLVDKLIEADPSGEYLQTFRAASQYAKQFSNENFTNGVTSYVQNTFIDVLNKFGSAEWTTLSEHFTSLQSDISATVSKLMRYNTFLGVNISNSPSAMFKSGMEDKTYLIVVAAIMIPVLAALTQFINVKLMPQPEQQDANSQMNSTMKSMNIMMPLMSAVFCWSLPSGMGLYWIAGAVVRCVQQVFVNKHIDKMDIDGMIQQNIEKQKEKEAKSSKKDKNRVEGSTVSTYSNMSTRGIQKNDKYSTKISKEQEARLEQAKKADKGKKYKKGSLAEKVNMVSEYNASGGPD